jgi:hypothetical protein
MAQVFPVAVAPTTFPSAPRAGEYYCTRSDLYRVEEVHGEFALLEDCRTEIVLEVAVSEVLSMDRVRPASG